MKIIHYLFGTLVLLAYVCFVEADYKCRSRQKIVRKQIQVEFEPHKLITIEDHETNDIPNDKNNPESAGSGRKHKLKPFHRYNVAKISKKDNAKLPFYYKEGTVTLSKQKLIGAIIYIGKTRYRIISKY